VVHGRQFRREVMALARVVNEHASQLSFDPGSSFKEGLKRRLGSVDSATANRIEAGYEPEDVTGARLGCEIVGRDAVGGARFVMVTTDMGERP